MAHFIPPRPVQKKKKLDGAEKHLRIYEDRFKVKHDLNFRLPIFHRRRRWCIRLPPWPPPGPWSQPSLLARAPTTSYDSIDSSGGAGGSSPALGAANTAYSPDMSTDDDGGNGWMFAHSSIVGRPNNHLLLHPFAPRSDTSIGNG